MVAATTAAKGMHFYGLCVQVKLLIMITLDKGSDNNGSVGVIIGVVVVVLLVILVVLTLVLLATMIWKQRQRKGKSENTTFSESI